MREEMLKGFETQLLIRKKELQDVIASNELTLQEQLNPEDGSDARLDVNHPADMIGADPDYDKQIELIRRERAELAMVSAALARIAQKSFGECEACHQSIPFERLQAIPYTRYCIECKQDKDIEAQSDRRASSGANPHGVANIGL